MNVCTAAALVCAGCLLSGSSVLAAEPALPPETVPLSETAPVIGSADGPTGIFIGDAAEADTAAEETPMPSGIEEARPSHPGEIQLEYADHRFYKNRHIDNYTLHLYQEMKRNGTVSFWRGLTLTRPTGYLREDDGTHRDSDAWGLGPSVMVRWEKPVSEKWSVGIDGTGSLLAYNHAFPAGGRAFGFLWRAGPRISYYPDKDSAFRIGWSFMHCSNGFSSHNPGYNGAAFSLMYAHNF